MPLGVRLGGCRLNTLVVSWHHRKHKIRMGLF
ncbi:MAG: hypothetical protein ACFWT5_08785 [Pseudomonas helleri]